MYPGAAVSARGKLNGLGRKWSQEKLAERASMQRSYIAALERGSRNPSVRTLVKVANALAVSVSDLFDSKFRE